MNNNIKKRRHEIIIELIEQYEIETQEELADKLCASGYQVTQATVSRDIRELKLSKIPFGKGRQKYVAFTQNEAHLGDKYIRGLKEGYVAMAPAHIVMMTLFFIAIHGFGTEPVGDEDRIRYGDGSGCSSGCA